MIRTAAAVLAVSALVLAGGCASRGGDEPEIAEPETTEPENAEPDTTEPENAEPEAAEPTSFLSPGDLIAVSLPWVGTCCSYFEMFGPNIEAAGFQAVVDDAGYDSGKQIEQIEWMIAQGAKVIIVGAVDGTQLGNVLDQAKDQGIIVLGYDRTIDGTASVDGVVQYGALATGEMEGEALLQGLEESGAPKPWTIELFAGAPTDPNALFFFDGAMSLLQPMIDAGEIIVGSEETEFDDVATAEWANEKAQTRMEKLLASTYSDGVGPVGVLAPNDGIARAILTACEAGGFDQPVVGGLDAEDISIGWVRTGKQYATVSKPTHSLIARTIEVINYLLTSPTIPDPDFTLNNGVKDVGIYSLNPTILTQANIDDYFPCEAAADAEQATNWKCD